MERWMKYIIVKYGGKELPIVFSNRLNHASVAGNYIVVSAGFVIIRKNNESLHKFYPDQVNEDLIIVTTGESGSLHISSRKEDIDIIRASLDEFKKN